MTISVAKNLPVAYLWVGDFITRSPGEDYNLAFHYHLGSLQYSADFNTINNLQKRYGGTVIEVQESLFEDSGRRYLNYKFESYSFRELPDCDGVTATACEVTTASHTRRRIVGVEPTDETRLFMNDYMDGIFIHDED